MMTNWSHTYMVAVGTLLIIKHKCLRPAFCILGPLGQLGISKVVNFRKPLKIAVLKLTTLTTSVPFLHVFGPF